MCTGIVETAEVSGSGKGSQGWFSLEKVHVSYDHPFHAPLEHALNIDFMSKDSRLAVELDAESAARLVDAITKALLRGGIDAKAETAFSR